MRNILKTAALLLLLAAAGGCVKEIPGGDPSCEKEIDVTLKLNLPPSLDQSPATRSLTADQENLIKTIDVYTFMSNSDGKYYFRGRVTRITNPTNPITQFIVPMVAYPAVTQKLMIVVNARDASDYGITKRDDLEAAKKKLTISRTAVWAAHVGTGGWDPLPMYAESPALTITEHTTSAGPLRLVRMHARVDIKVRPTTVEDPQKFTLREVFIFQMKTKGMIGYDISASNWNAGEGRTIAPNMPPDGFDAITKYKQPCNISGNQAVRDLYIFEAPYNDDFEKRTAIVVGGYYSGTSGTRYYRIDIPEGVTGGHILRNCLYDIEIQNAAGIGSPTPEEAYLSGTMVNFTINAWTDAGQNITSDGQHTLWLEKSAIYLNKEGTQKTLNIRCDHPDGVKVETPANPWFEAVPEKGSGDNWTIKITGDNNSAVGTGFRNSYFTVVAGNLKYKVTVDQLAYMAIKVLDATNASTLANEVPNIDYYFTTGAPTGRKVRVQWWPKSLTVNVKKITTGDVEFTPYPSTPLFPGNGATITNYTVGYYDYQLSPGSFDESTVRDTPFSKRGGKWTFSVTYGDVTETAELEVTYQRKLPIFDIRVEPNAIANTFNYGDRFCADGNSYSFRILSNAPWEVSDISYYGGYQNSTNAATLLDPKPGDNLAVGLSGPADTQVGTEVRFTTVNTTNLYNTSGYILVTLKSTNTPLDFSPTTYRIHLGYNPRSHGGFAGCNIYWDAANNRFTFDDVGVTTHEKYQGVFFKAGSLVGISPKTRDYGTSGNGAGIPVYYPDGTTATGKHFINDIKEYPYRSLNADLFTRAAYYENQFVDDEVNWTGDICRYLTGKPGIPAGKWRMPSAYELSTMILPTSTSEAGFITSYNFTGTITPDLVNDDGTYQISNGARLNAPGTPFMPASGYRFSGYSRSTFTSQDIGRKGNYLPSAYIYIGTYPGDNVWVGNNYVEYSAGVPQYTTTQGNYYYRVATPVRCVRVTE